MAPVVCFCLSVLVLQGSSGTYMPAKVVRVESTKLVVSNKGKDHILLIGSSLKVMDSEGQEIAEPDLKKLLKVGEGVTVRTAKARPEDFPGQKLDANAKMVTEIRLPTKGPSGDRGSGGGRTVPRPGSGNAIIKEAEVVKVDRGKLTAKVEGKERRFGFSVRVKAFDLEGKEPKLAAQLLVPGNLLELKTTAPDPAEVRAGRFAEGEVVITEMRLVRGTLGSMESTGSTSREASDVKRPGDMLTESLSQKQWDAYYKSAKVGDFIEYRRQGDKKDRPSRSEVMEVGDKFVVVLTTSYHFGQPDHTWRKRVPREITGPGLPGSGAGRRSQVELEVNGRTLKCELVESGDKKTPDRKWTCAEVPFDGLVRQEGGGKVIYELVDFGRGTK